MTHTVCPNCGSQRIHRSRRRRPIERFMALLGATMRRCHDCNGRYAELGHSVVTTSDLSRVSRKLSLALAMAAAVVFVMVAILWLGRKQSVPVSDTGCVMPSERSLPAQAYRV